MHELETHAELVKQQRIIAGCLLRKEMRECGVWGPMPKMDGTELPPELAVRFPKSEEELRYLAYSDKIALVKEYSLSWSDNLKSCEDPGDIIHTRFITGERRRAAQPATAKGDDI